MKSLIIFSAFLLIFSTTAFAQLELPASFYGEAIINGRPVPVGSTITAEINDLQKGSITVFQEGMHGVLANTQLAVFPGEPDDTIIFFVQTLEMSNKLQAAETAVWNTGIFQEIDLTFTGEEIPVTTGNTGTGSTGGSSGGSSGGSGGGGPSTGTTNTDSNQDSNDNPVQPNKEVTESGLEIETYNLDEIFAESDTVVLSLNKGDKVEFTLNGRPYSMELASVGPGEVIISMGGDTFSVAISQDSGIDVNGDGNDDISLRLSSTSNGKARIAFTRAFEASEITGFAFGSPSDMGIAIVVIVVIIIIIAIAVSRSRMAKKTTRTKKR